MKAAIPELSEYQRYLADLEPLLKGVALNAIDCEKDLDFLAGDTGIARQHIMWMVAAAEYERRSADRSIPAAVFYGWFRQGLPSEPRALWATPTETLVTALAASIDRQIVPPIGSSMRECIGKRIDRLKIDLAPPSTATLPGLAGDALGALTGSHLPLMQVLQSRLQRANDGEGSLRPLAALRPDEWLDLAYTHGTPEGIAITPEAYADALAASVERQHPTAALEAHLTRGGKLAHHRPFMEVGAFLRANPSFDIVTANLTVLLDQSDLSGIAQPQKLVDGLRSLQRMNMLGARWEETAALLENGLDSK